MRRSCPALEWALSRSGAEAHTFAGRGTVASIRRHAVANHRAAKQLGGGVLVSRRQRAQA